MQLEVLKAQFEAYKGECAMDRLALETSVKENRLAIQTSQKELKASIEAFQREVQLQLDSKVPNKQFYWVMGILSTLLLTVCGYISTQLKDLSASIKETADVTTSVQADVSYLKGKLSPYDVEFTP